MSETLTSKTLHGIKWSYLSSVINTVLQIGFTAIMARLLEPTAFGLVAMAGVVLRFGSYFSQMGVGRALIQKKEISNEDIRAAFTSSLTLGSAFFGLAWISAPLATYIFRNAEVIPIIRIMALSFVLSGVSATALSLLQRNLEFRSLAIISIVSYVVGYGGVGVTLAYSGFGVWSLVIGALSQSAILAVLSYLFSRHALTFIYRWKYYKQLYSFGSKISLISFFQFISSNLDTISIGHFLDARRLGMYNRAHLLASLPSEYIFTSLSKVLFPSFSRMQTEIAKLRTVYLLSLTLMWIILMPITLGMIPAANEIVTVVLGKKWIQAVPIFQILLTMVPFSLATNFSGVVMQAMGRLKVMLLWEVLYLCFLVMAFYAVAPFGLVGFAATVALGSLIRSFGYFYFVSRILEIRLSQFVKTYSVNFITSAMVFGSIFFARAIFGNVPAFLLLFIDILVGLFIYYLANILILSKYFKVEIGTIIEKLQNNVNPNGIIGKTIRFYRTTMSIG